MESRKLTVSQSWLAHSSNVNYLIFMLTLLEFVLCVTGTTAPAEGIFSLINMCWFKENSRLNVKVLKLY